MRSYRDTTFCEGDGCIRFGSCPRALTQEVRDAASELELPISQFVDPKALDCHDPSRDIHDEDHT